MKSLVLSWSICTLTAQFLSTLVWADKPGLDAEYTKASEDGGFFARCIPGQTGGSSGKTLIYKEKSEGPQLVVTYDWFAQQIYFLGEAGSVVRLGEWPNGRKASRKDLAIAFYKDGRFLKSYSTPDIAGHKNNVLPSVSHYQVFENIGGYKRISGKWIFEAKRIDGRILLFDVVTENKL